MTRTFPVLVEKSSLFVIKILKEISFPFPATKWYWENILTSLFVLTPINDSKPFLHSSPNQDIKQLAILTARIFVTLIETVVLAIAFLFFWYAQAAAYTFELRVNGFVCLSVKSYFLFWKGISRIVIAWVCRLMLLTSLRAHSQFSSSSPSGQSLALSQTASCGMQLPDLHVNSSAVHAIAYMFVV